MSVSLSWGRFGRREKTPGPRKDSTVIPRIPPSRQRAVMRTPAAALAVVVGAGSLMLGVSPAMAAAGDFTISLSAPETVPLSQNYNYTATVDFTGVDASHPASGVAMTTTLPEGTTFAGLPTGTSSPVLSHSYDPATRVLSMILNETTEDLLSVVYTVSQVDNEKKYEGFPLNTVMTGTGGPSGQVTSGPVTSKVTGPHDYRAQKMATTITGSTRREVTYRFNVCSEESYLSFSAYAQKLTDVFPAGAEFASASTGLGSWDTSAWPQATWTHNERYDHTGYCLDRSNTGIWLTVRYPRDVAGWEDGQRPPVNTVTLETTDANGVVRAGKPAASQGPVFSPGGGVTTAIEKYSGGRTSAGMIARSTYVNASYLGPRDSPRAEDLVITDSGTSGGPSEEWFHHNDVTAINAVFSPVLATEDLPYTLEYQTDFSDAWQSFTPAKPTTSTNLSLTVQNTGSNSWELFGGNNTLNVPPGSTLTGWRISVAPGAESVPVGSEVRVTVGSVPVFRDVTDGVVAPDSPAGIAPGPVNNTATLKAGGLTGQASDVFSPVDSVYLTTNVSAPTVLSVGDAGTIKAGIVNQNPSETYQDAVMSVVLPCGVLYDPSKTITPVTDVVVGVEPIPAIGNGVTVDSTSRVTDAAGCEVQVVTFTFDHISPMRDPREASHRKVENTGWQYLIPVTVLAKAYNPSASSIQVESYASTGDQRFIERAHGGTAEQTVPMIGYAPFFGEDIHNFDAARTSIAKATGRISINTAGGLLLDKLSGSSETGPWSLATTVDDSAFWQIYVSNVLPNPITGANFFDRLPAVATNDDFDVVLSGAVTGAPEGAKIEYSTDATDATSGVWTTDPANATAFRVVIDVLATGEDFTLLVPTKVLGNPGFGEKASNVLVATGTYNGQSVQFATNEAAVNIAGTSALAIEKKTNGEDVKAAPGPQVLPGSDVKWSYTVTNTGDVALKDVLVVDKDSAGREVFSGKIPSLAPGASVELSAQGKAVEGQYKNTVQAAAANPLGGPDLSASDDSYYFGAVPGLKVDKLVSTHQEGPWSEAVNISPNEMVYWQLSVTNTGNTVLTDVRFDDPALGAIEPVATLAPGETVSRVIAQANVTESYINVVVASATVPGGEGPTGTDSGEVVVEQVAVVPPVPSVIQPTATPPSEIPPSEIPPTGAAPAPAVTPLPATDELPDTGATGVMVGLAGAAVLLIAGCLALVASRRRSA
ncbi:LPXTG cell wall anchor domain-containing protein [Paenarthrobacter aurescens]|nr:LPXTG cell wall anchor domain-containing protein [Paenarthrobacter aurescens]MDO6145320.1 LPXTG cell wall anchor domain-containing protein [Paenarthrobacter aurescens]MDO6149125.1 LPXTG cell wall anchor domain-containing protein [Paenarthrobacter aurescens]MDO6160369.1 LPXTG cell wall anchor domain-containing protein [Paenarthrobacter aurescens]MDO6164228.1 LPXTG cell wall anchor domain-containing protein [Paenarthrobacter aurescens]